MKRILNTLFTLCLAVTMTAQTAVSVLDDVAARFKKDGDVEIDFTIKNDNVPSAGKIKLSGEKFCLELDGMVVWFDGETMWTYVADNQEVNVTNPSATEVAKMNPYAFVTMYRNGYEVGYGKSTSDYYEINLAANDASKSIKNINLRISKTAKRLQYVALTSAHGTSEVQVSSYNSVKHSPSAFVFDKNKYKDVEVIDLR